MAEVSVQEKLANVMIVDDDDVSNFIYTRVITASKIGEHIDSFLNSQEALDYLKNLVANAPENFPDLIFLDINMPVLDGWDFMEAYVKMVPKSLQKKTVLCILSSSVFKKDIEKAYSYPQVKEYISKPLTTDQLENLGKKYFS